MGSVQWCQMPVRKFVTGLIAEKMRGKHIFRRGESATITHEQMDDACDVSDALFCQVIDLIDFNRVALEAHVRCVKQEHATPYGGACGTCIRDACLMVERLYGFDEINSLPLAVGRSDSDWPKDVARVVKYRK